MNRFTFEQFHCIHTFMRRHRAFEIIHLHARGGQGISWYPFLADLFLAFLFTGCIAGFIAYGKECLSPYQEQFHIQLSAWHLPKYVFFSFSRALCAYILSLLFSLTWGFWTAKDKFAEKMLIPLLDI